MLIEFMSLRGKTQHPEGIRIVVSDNLIEWCTIQMRIKIMEVKSKSFIVILNP